MWNPKLHQNVGWISETREVRSSCSKVTGCSVCGVLKPSPVMVPDIQFPSCT